MSATIDAAAPAAPVSENTAVNTAKSAAENLVVSTSTSASASQVRILPTLDAMDTVYELSRAGGPKSERFAAYVALTATNWGIVPFNPMAGDAARDAVQALRERGAETIAHETARSLTRRCEYTDTITLAVAVRSPGMWTDRVGTEVDERAIGKERVAHRGVVSLWSRESCTASDVAREAAAETVRVMWHALHGVPDTLHRVLAVEGLAYALAEGYGGLGPYSGDAAPEDAPAVRDACDVLGDTRQAGEIVGVLYGDGAATHLGWTPLGITRYAGYRCAITRAATLVREHGAGAVLRAGVPS